MFIPLKLENQQGFEPPPDDSKLPISLFLALGTSSKYYWENHLQHTTFDDTGGYSHKMEVITVMGQDPGAQPTIIGFLMANGANGCLFPQS